MNKKEFNILPRNLSGPLKGLNDQFGVKVLFAKMPGMISPRHRLISDVVHPAKLGRATGSFFPSDSVANLPLIARPFLRRSHKARSRTRVVFRARGRRPIGSSLNLQAKVKVRCIGGSPSLRRAFARREISVCKCRSRVYR